MGKKISGLILREDINTYERANGSLSVIYLRHQTILDRAEENLKLFAEGKLEINPGDFPTFAKYINTFSPDDETRQKLFAGMRKEYGFNAEKSLQEQNMSDWQYLKSTYLPKRFNRVSNTFKKVWNRSKVALLGAVIFIGSAFGMKSDDNPQKLQKTVTTTVEATPRTMVKKAKTIDMNNAKESIAALKYKEVYRNFYNTKIEILTSAAQRQALYSKIDTQINGNIFKLPKHISKEQVAYVDVMYKAYGLKSPIENALTSKHKLSEAQQNQLIKDLNIKDSEIKNKARTISGKLGRHSSFDKANLNLQQQHLNNLRKLRELS